jgi:DNA-binding transcriptional LysR family regulator
MTLDRDHHFSAKSRRAGETRSLDWDGARMFLEISRVGSLRAASGPLQTSVNTLRRRLERLEHGLGVTLFTRHVDGVRVTEEGERVLAAAQRMEGIAHDLIRAGHPVEGGDAGEVALAATEGLGAFWIAPRVAAFQEHHPATTLNLRCAMAKVDLLRLEADVAVQLERPAAKDLKVVKLARLHLMPFASPGYIAEHGMPTSAADLEHHRMVLFAADQIPTVEQYLERMPDEPFDGQFSLRNASSAAHYFSILSGAGIGLLPTYAAPFGAPLVPIDVGYRSMQDVWLAYHPDAVRAQRVTTVIDWLKTIFSPHDQPWFADRFVHPREFTPAA